MTERDLFKSLRAGVCTRCGSTKIIPGVRLIDRTQQGKQDLVGEIYKDPEALLFKGAVGASMVAWVCGQCGYTEIYTVNSDELYREYMQIVSEKKQSESLKDPERGRLSLLDEEDGAGGLSLSPARDGGLSLVRDDSDEGED